MSATTKQKWLKSKPSRAESRQAKPGQQQQQKQLPNRHLPLLYATSTQLNCFLCLYETLCVCPHPTISSPPYTSQLYSLYTGFIKILLQLFAFAIAIAISIAFAITCLTLCLLIFSLAFLFLQIMKSAAHKICTNYSTAAASAHALLRFSACPLPLPYPLRSWPSPIQHRQVLSCFSHFVFLPTLYFFIYAKCIEKINKIINESRTRLVWFFLTFLFIFCYFVILLLCIPLWFRFRPSTAIHPASNQPPNNENRKTQKYKTDAQPATMD